MHLTGFAALRPHSNHFTVGQLKPEHLTCCLQAAKKYGAPLDIQRVLIERLPPADRERASRELGLDMGSEDGSRGTSDTRAKLGG